MLTALLVIDVLACAGLIGLILLQHGKGADVGAAFGSGASQTVFGSQGSASFLTRTTAALAVVFFVTSLGLAYLSGQQSKGRDVVERLAPVSAPAPSPQSDLPPQSAVPGSKVVIDPITGLPARPKAPSGEAEQQRAPASAPAPVVPVPPN